MKTKSATRRVLDIFSYIVLFLTFVIVCIYAYFNLYPFKIVEYGTTDNDGHGVFEVLTPEVKNGEDLKFRVDYDKLLPYHCVQSCYFIDGVVYYLPDRTGTGEYLCKHHEIREVEIPHSLTAGEYIYGCTVKFHLPMGRVVTYKYHTGTFKIIN